MSKPETIDWVHLRAIAVEFSAKAYAPYSKYRVGAAGVTASGRIVGGCNVENAAYGVTLCAECGLVSDLVAGGGGALVGVVCVNALGEVILPCGRCRQLLVEHGGERLLIMTPQGALSMSDLLPMAFGPAALERVNDAH